MSIQQALNTAIGTLGAVAGVKKIVEGQEKQVEEQAKATEIAKSEADRRQAESDLQTIQSYPSAMEGILKDESSISKKLAKSESLLKQVSEAKKELEGREQRENMVDFKERKKVNERLEKAQTAFESVKSEQEANRALKNYWTEQFESYKKRHPEFAESLSNSTTRAVEEGRIVGADVNRMRGGK